MTTIKIDLDQCEELTLVIDIDRIKTVQLLDYVTGLLDIYEFGSVKIGDRYADKYAGRPTYEILGFTKLPNYSETRIILDNGTHADSRWLNSECTKLT